VRVQLNPQFRLAGEEGEGDSGTQLHCQGPPFPSISSLSGILKSLLVWFGLGMA